MSVIVNASGELGSSFSPHFAVTAKEEPGRHDLHKIKSTFTKIHGLGTSVYLTHSHLDSNLVLETMYKSMESFMELRKIFKIRNLYV
jgi:hypothetical protein